MDAEIFLTPTFHMVKVKKCNGDTLEYQKLVKEDLRPDLADIVFVWARDVKQVDPFRPVPYRSGLVFERVTAGQACAGCGPQNG
ncbi:BnaC05g13490D [Brassica napus]|uniref:BnaC05g13490D protein n=4 Tax=Brassica TaxID=3705 RepID=A0A078IGG4_BRANA|nr:hypothetical protein F2Q69_00026959 [Brassica cretica]CDY48489.1 BnaC05g13490D [Brassica napus]VDD42734.1 unnamed protein product [Brassica oleracea]